MTDVTETPAGGLAIIAEPLADNIDDQSAAPEDAEGNPDTGEIGAKVEAPNDTGEPAPSDDDANPEPAAKPKAAPKPGPVSYIEQDRDYWRNYARQLEAQYQGLEQSGKTPPEVATPSQVPAATPAPGAGDTRPNPQDPKYHYDPSNPQGQAEAAARYIEDLTAWKAEQIVQQTLSKRDAEEYARRETERQHQQQRAADMARDAAMRREMEFAQSVPDYQQTVTPVVDLLSQAIAVQHPLAEFIANSEESPALGYYFGKHPGELESLLNMDPRKGVLKLGVILEKATAKPEESQATQQPFVKPPPKPIEPLKRIDGGNAVIDAAARFEKLISDNDNIDDALDYLRRSKASGKRR